MALDPVDARQWRQPRLEPRDQPAEVGLVAADAQKHAFAVVEHLAGKAELAGDAPHRRAEAHTLHSPAHPDFERLRRLANDAHRACRPGAYMLLILM